jgi:hypothetical protein
MDDVSEPRPDLLVTKEVNDAMANNLFWVVTKDLCHILSSMTADERKRVCGEVKQASNKLEGNAKRNLREVAVLVRDWK